MTETLVIALAVLVPLCIIVVLLMRQTKKQTQRTRKKISGLLEQIVAQNKLQISFKDELEHKVLALDPERKTLVYIWYYGELMYDIIDLGMVTSCHIKYTNNAMKKNSSKLREEGANRISISLTAMNVEIFDLLVYSELNDGIAEKASLSEKAVQWQQAIQGVIGRK